MYKLGIGGINKIKINIFKSKQQSKHLYLKYDQSRGQQCLGRNKTFQ